MLTRSPVNSNSVMPKFLADWGNLLEWVTNHYPLIPCFCSKVPPTPSQEVLLFKQNKPLGIGAFNTGGLINNSLISLNAFYTSSVHLNFLDFFCKSYTGISSLLNFGRNEERKLTMPQNALVCFNVLGESRF